MIAEARVVARGRPKKKLSSLACSEEQPLKKKRGRKPRSLSQPPLPPGPLSFFKVLIGDFKDVLFIPPMAACTLKGLATKYVYIEDADGKYWDVRISMLDGALAFEKGWHDFLLDHSMTVGEFVLFTYTGGLIFTARVFGTSALERVDFQMKNRKGGCTKERCTTGLKNNLVLISKKHKVSQASEEKHNPSTTEVLRSPKRKKQTAQCDVPKFHVIKSESIAKGVPQVPSAGQKPIYDSNSKESGNALHDSEQTLHRNNDATVGKLNGISPTELVKSDIGNLEAVATKRIRNRRITTEKGDAHLQSSGALPSKLTSEKPNAMMKTATCAVKEHADIIERSPEMSGSLVQMNKMLDEMRNNGKMEQSNSHDLEMLDCEPLNDKIDAQSNLEFADCSTKMEFNPIDSYGISDKLFVTTAGICYTKVLDEMRNNEKVEQNNSHDLEMLDSEPFDDKMVDLSNLEFAKCSTKMEFNSIELEGIADKLFVTTNGICYTTLDEKLTACTTVTSPLEHERIADKLFVRTDGKCYGTLDEKSIVLATGTNPIEPERIADKFFVTTDGICCITLDEQLIVLALGTSFNANGLEEPICQNNPSTFGSKICVPCETISVVSSNPILDCTKDTKKKLMPIKEEYGDPQAQGIAHDAFFYGDVKHGTLQEKDGTPYPCLRRSRRHRDKLDVTDSAGIPSSSCVSFIVCISDDVQPSLELPKTFGSQIHNLRHKRKILVLQNLSMKCWPVLYHQSINFVGFIRGWVDFARANNICRGDICKFELVDKMELKFQVLVTKSKNLYLS